MTSCNYTDGNGIQRDLSLEAPLLFGRRDITTNADVINADNVLDELNKALIIHGLNCNEEEYLYWYRRGFQPVLGREKEIRPDILNKVVENHAEEIVQFKNGYFLTQPATYISRKGDEDGAKKVEELNEYLYRSGKALADTKCCDWFHTVGKGVIFCEPRNDKKAPLKVYALDPRNAFVVYSSRPGSRPMMGVSIVQDSSNRIVFDVFTEYFYFKCLGGALDADMHIKFPLKAIAIEMESSRPNVLGHVPLIEYRYNLQNEGSFEPVISLMDALNLAQSNRLDGVDQFIQSLAVAVNCDFEEDVTLNEIRKAGMIVLKSVGDNKADFRILAEQLNQTETQVLVSYLYQQILTISGLPATTKGARSTSDTGAAVLARDGWYQADNFARNTTDLYKESNAYFDEIFVEALRRVGFEINIGDFEVQIAHNETSNLLVKAQGALNLKELGLAPEIVLSRSGVSNDPVADVAASKPYIDKAWGMKPNGEMIPTNFQEQQQAEGVETEGNGGGNLNEKGKPKGDWIPGYYRHTELPDNRK